GAVADVLGRKRVIVVAMFLLALPTLMVGLSSSLSALIFWRAMQGLVLPPIFAVTIAYIGDEWSAREATTAAGIYSSGSSIGGFSGRLVTGFFADLVGWRYGFMALAAIALAGAGAVALLLPHERKFVRSAGLIASARRPTICRPVGSARCSSFISPVRRSPRSRVGRSAASDGAAS